MIDFQTKIYEMPNFDLAQAIQKSKTSPEKMISFTTVITKETFSLFPILEIFTSKSGKVVLLLLPNEKCIFIGEMKGNNYYEGIDPLAKEVIKNLSVGYWVMTEEGKYTKGEYETKAFLCEKTTKDAIALIGEMEKAKKSGGYHNNMYFGNDESGCYNLQNIKLKVREASIKSMTEKIAIQLEAYKTWKCLSKVIFDMPSVETSRITFTSDNHTYVFIYPYRDNPSQKLTSDELNKPEEIEDAHYWVQAVRNENWADGVKRTLSQGIQYFMTKKDWFEFSVDGKQLKVEMKDFVKGNSPQKTQRVYVETIPTRIEEVMPALLSLIDKTKEDVIYDLDNTHKLSPEMKDVLSRGLSGHVVDLEGKIDISTQIVRHGNKYFLPLNGKEYQIEGGFQTIKKLQSFLDGNSKRCARWDKLEVQWNRDVKLFIDLLVEALGEEKGIEVYQLLKKKNEENSLLYSKALQEFIDKNSMNISKTMVDKEPCYKIRIQNGNNIREFYLYGFKGFELCSDGKKHDINNLRCRNYGDGENHSDDENILYNFNLIIDGKAEVNDYGF
jgi:hypothetical protein